MNFIQTIKQTLVSQLRSIAGKFGAEIQRANNLDLQIRRLRSIKNFKTRLNAAEELVQKYPKHPKTHMEFTTCLHILDDNRQFEQLDRYAAVMREWLIETGFDELDMEFISPAMVLGSFGNHYYLECLLLANKYGLRPAKRLFLLPPDNVQLRNPALFSYFEPYLHVIRDREAIFAFKKLESILSFPLGLGVPLSDCCPFPDIVYNMAEVERKKQGLKLGLFELSDIHREMGAEALTRLGLPKDAWYITLHMREPGYRGETADESPWRNCNPMKYLKACKAITQAGGWVFRMGDPSMTPMPKMHQVIDHAHHEIRSDWMDIFLGATCKFLLTNGSGYSRVPGYFGVPVIYSDISSFIGYYSFSSHDIYLPRWIKKNRSGKLLSFEEYMTPPISMLSSEKNYNDAGVQWVENSPEELEAVTKEMLTRIEGNSSSIIPNDDLQNRFKSLAENYGVKYSNNPVKAFASISRDFLEMHVDLL